MAASPQRRPGPEPEEGLAGTCRAYDIVGDVVIAKIPSRLDAHRDRIGLTLLRRNPQARLVLQVVGPTSRDTRVRKMRRIAGTGPTFTQHREHGATYVVDVSKVFFSPRLSHERWRVARQVRDGERVVNMFAGVGSFSILIARHRRATVYSIDMNPDAVDCMRRGIGINRLLGRVVPLLADAAEICRGMKSIDRAILALPAISDQLLGLAADMLQDGGMIHHYREVRGIRRECVTTSLNELAAILAAIDDEHHLEVLGSRVVRSVGSKRWHIVHDIRVHWESSTASGRKEI